MKGVTGPLSTEALALSFCVPDCGDRRRGSEAASRDLRRQIAPVPPPCRLLRPSGACKIGAAPSQVSR